VRKKQRKPSPTAEKRVNKPGTIESKSPYDAEDKVSGRGRKKAVEGGGGMSDNLKEVREGKSKRRLSSYLFNCETRNRVRTARKNDHPREGGAPVEEEMAINSHPPIQEKKCRKI